LIAGDGSLVHVTSVVHVLDRRESALQAQSRVSLHARPNMRPDRKRHTLRARVALVREMPPPQPPRKARTKLKHPQPRRRRIVQPTRPGSASTAKGGE
jgi:hypothetical protein